MNKADVIEGLKELLEENQINLNEDDLYEASADRYKKYARAKKVLDVPAPAAIVYPDTAEEVQKILRYCNNNHINVIPRSGQTATEGGLENWKELAIVLDAKRLNKIIKIDDYNMQATVQAGVQLQVLEDELRKIGYTTGHSPQSKPVAQYGYLIKDVDTGIKVLREVIVNGFRPSVARTYSEEDARQHFYHFHRKRKISKKVLLIEENFVILCKHEMNRNVECLYFGSMVKRLRR